MRTAPRTWRKTRQTRARGPYWSLQAGARTAEDRVAITLGYVSEPEAERALQAMQEEESALFGTPRYDRVLRLYEADKDAARRYLISDPAEDALFPVPAGAEAVQVHHPAIPLREYVRDYYGPHRKQTKPRTWRTEEGDWRRINAAIGHVRLGDVDEFVVDEYLTNLTKLNGEPASYNMRRKHRNAITACLSYARRKRHREDPIPQWFRLEGSHQRTHGEPTDLTREEVTRLMAVADARLRCIIGVGVGLGLRPSEIVALRWEHVDLDGGRILVEGTKTRAANAYLPLLPLARAELQRYHQHLGAPTDGLLFPHPRSGERIRGPATFRKALSTAAEAAGLGSKRITPYTLRHSCATLLVEAGVPMHSVAKLLRHTNPRMLEKNYDHTGALRAPGLDRAPEWEEVR